MDQGVRALELKIFEREGGVVCRHEAMATELSLWLGGVDGTYAKQAALAFFERIDEVESKLSLYRESSDVSRINLLNTGEHSKVSLECVECLAVAMHASQITHQRFHPFLGAESLKVKGGVPWFLKDKVESNACGGEASIELDPETRRVTRVGNGGILDLGGVGKGYALDVAFEILEDWEVPQAMASFGGSTLFFRDLEGSGIWAGELGKEIFELRSHEALSSSGIGFKGEHIVSEDADTDRLYWDRTFVRCENAGLADALSTGCMLMSEEELEGMTQREPGVRIAASKDERVWGMGAFCKGGSR